MKLERVMVETDGVKGEGGKGEDGGRVKVVGG